MTIMSLDAIGTGLLVVALVRAMRLLVRLRAAVVALRLNNEAAVARARGAERTVQQLQVFIRRQAGLSASGSPYRYATVDDLIKASARGGAQGGAR